MLLLKRIGWFYFPFIYNKLIYCGIDVWGLKILVIMIWLNP